MGVNRRGAGSGRRAGAGGVQLDELVNGDLVGRRNRLELQAKRGLGVVAPDDASRRLDVA